jgi:hypothetical protein
VEKLTFLLSSLLFVKKKGEAEKPIFNPLWHHTCGMRVYPENTGTNFITNSLRTTNQNLNQGFHPHPHLLPLREKNSESSLRGRGNLLGIIFFIFLLPMY